MTPTSGVACVVIQQIWPARRLICQPSAPFVQAMLMSFLTVLRLRPVPMAALRRGRRPAAVRAPPTFTVRSSAMMVMTTPSGYWPGSTSDRTPKPASVVPRSFLDYLVEHGMLEANPLRAIKLPKSNRARERWLDWPTVLRLLHAIPTPGDGGAPALFRCRDGEAWIRAQADRDDPRPRGRALGAAAPWEVPAES